MVDKDVTTLLQSLTRKVDQLLSAVGRPPQRYQTIAHSAAYADLSEESIRRLIAAGKLTALRPVRGRILIDRHELDAVIRASTKSPRTGRGRASHP